MFLNLIYKSIKADPSMNRIKVGLCYCLVFYMQSLDKEGEARENYQFDFEQQVAILKHK